MFLDFGTMIYRIPALLFAITVHEYAHAICADSMGDKTPRFMGRLTLNPMAHLDIFGSILLIVAGFGWAKPVVINDSNFRNRREGVVKVSLAGPAANLFLCFLAAVMAAIVEKLGLMSPGLRQFLVWIQLYNVWFAIFNLLPITPLDGAKLAFELLPPKQAWSFKEFVDRYGFYIILGLVFTGVLSYIISPLARIYLIFINSIIGFIF